MANPTIHSITSSGSTVTLSGTGVTYAFPYDGPAIVVADAQTKAVTAGLAAIAAAISGLTLASAPSTQPPPASTTPPASTQPPASSTPAATGQKLIAVGPTRQFTEPADALPFIAPGGTLMLDDATYLKPFNSFVDVILQSVSGNPRRCRMDGQGGFGGGHRMAWGKAFAHFTACNGTVLGIGFVRCGSPQSGRDYSNEAAIYWENTIPAALLNPDDKTSTALKQFTLTVSGCAFDDNANGIFSDGDAALTVAVSKNVFGLLAPNGMNGATNGTASGAAHDCYLSAKKVDVGPGNFFYGSAAHNVKTRADETVVHDNPLLTQDGGRIVDAAEGGLLTIANNTVFTRTDETGRAIQPNLSPGNFGNANLIGYADENTKHGIPGGSITGNIFHISRQNSVIWAAAGVLSASANAVIFYGQGGLVTQGTVLGLSGGSAPPNAQPTPPPMPQAPF